MPRLYTAKTIEDAPGAVQPLLEGVQRQLGTVPNLFRMVASSPAALEGYLALSGALGKGSLKPEIREMLALVVAEKNGCAYCLSAHTYLAKNLARLSDAEIAANRKGGSRDPVADAVLKFAVSVMDNRGRVSDEALGKVREAGLGDAQIVEIVLHIALNTWTNYLNNLAETEIDFPVVMPEIAA